jgi:hypothetical protein
MKTIIATLVLISATIACAQQQGAASAPVPGKSMKVRHMTPEMKEKMHKRMGERIAKPGSQKGKIVFLNTQEEVRAKIFEDIASGYAKLTGLNIVYEKVSPGDPVALKDASKANLAIVIVADEKSPALLAAMEDGWAVVNLRKLAVGFANDEAKAKFYEARCQKEVLRAFAAIGGGMRSQYPNNVVGINRIEDLDLCNPVIPMDVQQAMMGKLAAMGVTPTLVAHYRQACKQGWAPAPTNDVQRAIWNKVHELPSDPIKIKYDPKRDK